MRSKALKYKIWVFILILEDNRLERVLGRLNRMIIGMFGKE